MAKHVSNNNSTSLLLTANQTFTGIVESVSIYESVSITIVSNQSSATDGIQLYMGPTSTNLSIKYTYSYTANENKIINLKLPDNFFKLVYIYIMVYINTKYFVIMIFYF